MHFIVLVKQVPDVANIPEDAWDREKGTLKRAVLDCVLNPLDLHALTLAFRIREKVADPDSKIVCLTMGPPQAREVLVDALARGADEAALLTDRAFSGADTVATAYSLARAIRKIEKDILGSRDYLALSGMQSVDGDTAQVPGQIAEDLDMDHIAYAQSFSYDKGLTIERIGAHGLEVVRPRRYPLLVTATACTAPLYKSFHRERSAIRKEIIEWSAADVEAEEDRIGAKGSRTRVYRIFSPREERAKECVFTESLDDLVARLEVRCHDGPVRDQEETGPAYCLGDRPPTYRGEVWTYVEQESGVINEVSLELIGKARELADCVNEKVGVALAGHDVEKLAERLIAQGADKVYLSEHPHLAHFRPIPYKKAIGDLLLRFKPQIMLFGATPLGRELAPRVAYRTGSGLTADCTRLEIDDVRQGSTDLTAILKQTRPALGGNIMATIMTKDSPIQMATVRPGLLKAGKPVHMRKGEIIRCPVEIGDEDIRTEIVSMEELPARTKISDADIVVAGGRGLGSRASFDRLIRPLAAAFGGFLDGRVEVGATRMAVEEGFVGHDCQVGQTGQTVRPRLYVAVAISGAVQHVSGMQNSDVVLAINKDPHARIFNYADFGVVADYETVIPRLIDILKARKSQ